MPFFKIIKKDDASRARVGVISTVHGDIQTPSYVMVATHGTVKALSMSEVVAAQTQVLISNTFHLWQHKIPDLEKAGGIHNLFGWQSMPIMTDSGGFQVFSYGFGREHQSSKVGILPKDRRSVRQIERTFQKDRNAVTVTDIGVRFLDGEKKYFLSPRRSIELQEIIGGDIMFAFDECTSPFHDYEYTKKALARTHAWASVCLESKTRTDQALYGIVQGGTFQDLRKESARAIGALPFDGFGIGGSFGEAEMPQVLRWVTDILDERQPRHLLGIGEIRNVLDAIEAGVDTFDCVIPTREARHGSIWTHDGRYDVRNASQRVAEPLERGCACQACGTITRWKLRDMFKSKDYNAGKWATIHNVFFFNRLMAEAQEAIREGRFNTFKQSTIARLKKKSGGH